MTVENWNDETVNIQKVRKAKETRKKQEDFTKKGLQSWTD